MTVHFIGAGPGAADLLTLRGRDLIANCPVCLYAGSLVPKEILSHCPKGAQIINTAPMSLDQIVGAFETAHQAGLDVARIHSGDLSLWSAMAEQLRRLRALDIPYSVTPGVPSFAAAAASLGAELTLPGVAQSVVLTRTEGRATSMPEKETLENFARTGTTLALHLSAQNLSDIQNRLSPYYGPDCPVAVIYRASWPEERILRSRVGRLAQDVPEELGRTLMIFVGPALAQEGFDESCLYATAYDRRYRPQSAQSPWKDWKEGDD